MPIQTVKTERFDSLPLAQQELSTLAINTSKDPNVTLISSGILNQSDFKQGNKKVNDLVRDIQDGLIDLPIPPGEWRGTDYFVRREKYIGVVTYFTP